MGQFSVSGNSGVSSVQLLLSLHANPSLSNATGDTALSLAEESAATSRTNTGCNQVVAILRNPEQYTVNPLSNTDVIGIGDSDRSSTGPQPLPPLPTTGEAVQSLFNGIGKLLAK